MPARLFCKTGELAGSQYDISQEAIIGRLSENEITLFPNVISGKHARIFFNEAEKSYFVEDLGSSNGTALDGITVEEPMRLDGLNVITFANELDFIFLSNEHLPKIVGREQPAPAKAAPSPAAPAFTPPPSSAPPAEDPHEKTRLGGFGAMPSFKPEADEEDPHDKTRLGDAFGAMPSFKPEADEEDPHDKTRLGDAFGAMPSFKPAAPEEDPHEKTRLGGDFGAIPSFKPDAISPPADDDGDHTLYGDAFGMMPPQQATQPAKGPSPFGLDVTFEGGRKKMFVLQQGENSIGRTDASDIHFPDNSISRNHAVFTVRGDRVFLQDKGSKNGTYINRKKLSTETEVQPGTTIQFGHQIMVTLGRRG